MAGNLERLPLEIRKEIYAHVFTKPEAKYTDHASYYIGVYITCKPSPDATGRSGRKRFHSAALYPNNRTPKHPGEVYDRSSKRWVKAPPGFTSLLLVSRAVSNEASQVLYGGNSFWFKNVEALELFAKQIGSSQEHIRYIAINGEVLKGGAS